MVVEREFDRWSGSKGETTEQAGKQRGGKKIKQRKKKEKKRRETKEKNGDAPTFVWPVLFLSVFIL